MNADSIASTARVGEKPETRAENSLLESRRGGAATYGKKLESGTFRQSTTTIQEGRAFGKHYTRTPPTMDGARLDWFSEHYLKGGALQQERSYQMKRVLR